jgi:hypothetical protein
MNVGTTGLGKEVEGLVYGLAGEEILFFLGEGIFSVFICYRNVLLQK